MLVYSSVTCAFVNSLFGANFYFCCLGFTAAYPTQSSIPYKYQPSVIPESEKKGFNSQAKRFYHKKVMALS